jgi:hypothetical protein
MKLLVVGAGGRLGAALAREFKEYDVTGFNHARLDLSNLTMTGAARFDFSLAHCELQWKPLHAPGRDRCDHRLVPEQSRLVRAACGTHWQY